MRTLYVLLWSNELAILEGIRAGFGTASKCAQIRRCDVSMHIRGFNIRLSYSSLDPTSLSCCYLLTTHV